jgi:hypothetical protein
MSWSTRHSTFNLLFLAIFTAVCNAQEATPYQPTIGTVFPSDNEVVWRTLSSVIHLLGTSIHSGYLFTPPILDGSLPVSAYNYASTFVSPILLIGHPGVSILAYCIARRSDVPTSGMYYPPLSLVAKRTALLNSKSRPRFYASRSMAFPFNLRR